MRSVILEESVVKPLTYCEQKKTDGGFLISIGIGGCILIGAAVATITEIIDDWDNFERGLTGEPYQPK